MKVDILNIEGQPTGRKADLPKEIFGIEPNDHVLYLAVKQYLANRRQGTHKTKERSELSGSTRKLKRQKGTGTARAGDIKNPLFRGGARVFGPRPRDYRFKLNKKVKVLARKSALSYKAKEKGIIVVEDFKIDEPRTRSMVRLMENLGIGNEKALFLVHETDRNLYLAGRNLPNAQVDLAANLNTYEVIHARKLVLSESALGVIKEILG